jgi:hydrogenase nickel incorporation protein HypA/HybF
MHETSIAQNIYEICRATVKEKGQGKLERVKVAVGELSGIEPGLLNFAWEALTLDSPDAGSILEIEWHPARQYCSFCGEEKIRSPGDWYLICLDCLQPIQILDGDELDVLEVSFLTD